MESNELRLGNIVIDSKGLEKQVSSISPCIIGYDNGTEDVIENVSGAPITEEALERFDFENKKTFRLVWEKESFTVGKATELDLWYLTFCDTIAFHLKYLHEIQNFYFIFRKKELEKR